MSIPKSCPKTELEPKFFAECKNCDEIFECFPNLIENKTEIDPKYSEQLLFNSKIRKGERIDSELILFGPDGMISQLGRDQ